MEAPVWFITGAARGFGKEFANVALANGCKVAACARKPEAVTEAFGESVNVLPVALDVTNPEQIADGVAQAIETFGRIDVLVNNAGFGLFGALEELSTEEIRASYETMVFGTINVTRAVLPYMRAQKQGRIVNMGSAASFVVDPGGALYDSTKAAVAALSEVLSVEMAPFGIESMVIMPGMFRTNFFDVSSIRTPANPIAEYDGTPARTAQEFCLSHNYQQKGDPHKVAELVYRLASSEEPMPTFLPVGKDAVKKFKKRLDSMAQTIEKYEDAASDCFVD